METMEKVRLYLWYLLPSKTSAWQRKMLTKKPIKLNQAAKRAFKAGDGINEKQWSLGFHEQPWPFHWDNKYNNDSCFPMSRSRVTEQLLWREWINIPSGEYLPSSQSKEALSGRKHSNVPFVHCLWPLTQLILTRSCDLCYINQPQYSGTLGASGTRQKLIARLPAWERLIGTFSQGTLNDKKGERRQTDWDIYTLINLSQQPICHVIWCNTLSVYMGWNTGVVPAFKPREKVVWGKPVQNRKCHDPIWPRWMR